MVRPIIAIKKTSLLKNTKYFLIFEKITFKLYLVTLFKELI